MGKLSSDLADSRDLDALGRGLILGAEKILPADFMLWNLWTPAMDALLGCDANHHHYTDELEKRGDALQATIQYHPVIATGHLDDSAIKPQRMSDFQSQRAFKKNPLYQEVYRHVESSHQIAYIAAKHPDSQIVLSWNMQGRDFTDREVQLLHLMGRQVGILSHRIEERRYQQEAWDALLHAIRPAMGSTAVATDPPPLLGAMDGRVLSGLIRGETRAEITQSLEIRRDTLDRHLGQLRERLGFDSMPQLMGSLAALRPESVARRRKESPATSISSQSP